MRHYFENHGNVTELHTDFGRKETPSAPYNRFLVKKLKEISILIDKSKSEKPKTVHKSENISAVASNVPEAPSTSIHCRSH